MSAPDSYAPGRDACELLKWFFAHEATFPKDPIALLRHIGIVVSANLAHTAASDEAAYWESWSPADGGSDCSQSYFHPTLDLATDFYATAVTPPSPRPTLTVLPRAIPQPGAAATSSLSSLLTPLSARAGRARLPT